MSDAEKPRVCFVLPSLNPGGTERQLLLLLAELREAYRCSVVCTRSAGAWAEHARAAGADVHELKSWGGWDFRIAGRIRKVLDMLRPDIVHTFLFGFDCPVNRIARQLGVPVVISSRRELAAWMKPRHVRMQRRANDLVDCVVANSNAVARFAQELEGLGSEQVRVIYNGIDADAFAQCAHGECEIATTVPAGLSVVGMVANFSEVKDHALFLSIAGVLLNRRTDMHFLLVGSGPLQEQIADDIHKNGWNDKFTITTATNNVAALIQKMDVVLLTSRREGFPNALLEAMALGRPVVAASVGGIPELVVDGATGILVSSRDAGHFAGAIERVFSDDAFAAKLRDAGAKRVREEFSVSRLGDAYRSLYRELLDKSRAEARS